MCRTSLDTYWTEELRSKLLMALSERFSSDGLWEYFPSLTLLGNEISQTLLGHFFHCLNRRAPRLLGSWILTVNFAEGKKR